MLARFLSRLFDSGRVEVGSSALPISERATSAAAAQPNQPSPPGEDDLAALRALRAAESVRRRNLPDGLPEFDEAVAWQAAHLLYRACQFLAYREFDAAAVQAGLTLPPAPPTAAAHYSADLALCYLPDVARLARAASPHDPLVARLLELGRRWPLSSVGMKGIGLVDDAALLAHPALKRMYVDRVIAASDAERAGRAELQAEIAAAVGAHPALARGLLGSAPGAGDAGML